MGVLLVALVMFFGWIWFTLIGFGLDCICVLGGFVCLGCCVCSLV